MSVRARHNVQVSGVSGAQPIQFSHGFGCDQNMWRYVASAFEDEYRVVLFDHVGHGGSDASAYDPVKDRSLDGYAETCSPSSTGSSSRTSSSSGTPSAR